MKKNPCFVCLSLIFSFMVISCSNLDKNGSRAVSDEQFFNQSEIFELESLIKEKEFIYLGENHEVMSERTSTEQTIDLVLKTSKKESLSCLFIEVPNGYNKYLKLYYSNNITYKYFLSKIPKSLHKMFSEKILQLYLKK